MLDDGVANWDLVPPDPLLSGRMRRELVGRMDGTTAAAVTLEINEVDAGVVADEAVTSVSPEEALDEDPDFESVTDPTSPKRLGFWTA